MKENEITVIINKPIGEVFEFCINPKNTPTRISSIVEEIADEYPPKIGTKYKNRGEKGDRDFYKFIEFEKNKMFILTDLDENYHVKYTYKKLEDNKTEVEYFEWMKEGELSKPFTEDILIELKTVVEKG